MSDNPYAAPVPAQKLLPSTKSEGIWRDGDLLVVHRNATLPDICVKSNELASKRIHRKFYWHSPILFLLILLHLLIYAVVALLVRKKHELDIPVSDETASKRTNGILFGWLIGGLGIAMLIGGIVFLANSQRGDALLGVYAVIMLGGFIVMLIGLVVGSRYANILIPKKMNQHATWFKGAGADFVRTLPEIPPKPE